MRENTPYRRYTKDMDVGERHRWFRELGDAVVTDKMARGDKHCMSIKAIEEYIEPKKRFLGQYKGETILLEWYNQSPTRLGGVGW